MDYETIIIRGKTLLVAYFILIDYETIAEMILVALFLVM